MRMVKAITLLTLLVLVGQTALAGTFSPGLEKQVRNLRGSDEIKVLVVLRDQADIATLNHDLHVSKATRMVRHATVMGVLQDTADRSQGALLSDLAAHKAAGGIVGYTPHWLVNAVVVRGTVDALREIAARADVETIEPDLQVELIEPIPSEKPHPSSPLLGIGTTPGVQSINAPRVWNELGINGTGVIVGELDTGVDGNHPALAARWQGNFADPSTAWYDAANLGDPSFPVDRHYHGTHTMGTVTGLAPDDTIGVAPGAHWIATNCINMSTGPEFDNAVIASFEFMADPDGDPNTTADVPCVVQNSWGVNEGFTGYFDCDSRWWAAIDNCEAAGVCVTWSAGNEGPGGTSLRSPADRAETPYNCFSVGATITTAPFTIADFSSRGPSGCGGAFATKPEVSAPGVDVYSAEPGGGYQYLSGTSMAGPHVAGIVALMCSANPDLDVDTIKQVLMDTAHDLGTPGEDNTYGWGFVDAYDAVLAVISGYGRAQGVISDASTGNPIAGATVSVDGRPNFTTTQADGSYFLMLPADSYTFRVNAFGYAEGTINVTVLADDVVDASGQLTALPSAMISGRVYDYTGALVPGATVRALDTPVPAAVADGSGFYSLSLPIGATYDLVGRAVGFGAQLQTVNLTGNLTLDFTLPELTAEDFETGDFLQYPWEMSGNAPWVTTTNDPYEGTYCAMSGDINDSQSSTMSVTVDILAPQDLTFAYKVSSEATYDFLRFFDNGTEIVNWSGTVPWAVYTYAATAGIHTFQWSYTKDGSLSTGDDAGYVDFIEFPTLGEAQLVMDTSGFDVTAAPGSVVQRTLDIGNAGDGTLTYLFTTQYDPQGVPDRVADVPFHEVEKGKDDPNSGTSPVANFGGPDGFGYSWIDSNEPNGPVFDWVDITGVGTNPGGGDDSNYGPFNLGFDFPFYGQAYSSVRVCTNGFISFTSTVATYTNQAIPLTDEPNCLIAPFWDDLNLNNAGTMYYYADTANSRFIVEWAGVDHYNPIGNPETFEVILNADGSIVYQYATVAVGNSCTIGIENADGTDGLQAVYNADYVTSGMAIRFAVDPTLRWLSVSPVSGSVPAGGSTQVTLQFDATELPVGVYSANLLVGTNDQANRLVTLPVTFSVGDATAVTDALPRSLVFSGAAPNPFNPMTSLKFALPHSAHVDLRIYDISGRLVRSLVSDVRPAGDNEVQWNGTDAAGRGVASGTYYARLTYEGTVATRSLVLVR